MHGQRPTTPTDYDEDIGLRNEAAMHKTEEKRYPHLVLYSRDQPNPNLWDTTLNDLDRLSEAISSTHLKRPAEAR